MIDKRDKKELARLRRIFAYALSDQPSWEACDIPTRETIERLTYRVMRVKEPRVIEI